MWTHTWCICLTASTVPNYFRITQQSIIVIIKDKSVSNRFASHVAMIIAVHFNVFNVSSASDKFPLVRTDDCDYDMKNKLHLNNVQMYPISHPLFLYFNMIYARAELFTLLMFVACGYSGELKKIHLKCHSLCKKYIVSSENSRASKIIHSFFLIIRNNFKLKQN